MKLLVLILFLFLTSPVFGEEFDFCFVGGIDTKQESGYQPRSGGYCEGMGSSRLFWDQKEDLTLLSLTVGKTEVNPATASELRVRPVAQNAQDFFLRIRGIRNIGYRLDAKIVGGESEFKWDLTPFVSNLSIRYGARSPNWMGLVAWTLEGSSLIYVPLFTSSSDNQSVSLGSLNIALKTRRSANYFEYRWLSFQEGKCTTALNEGYSALVKSRTPGLFTSDPRVGEDIQTPEGLDVACLEIKYLVKRGDLPEAEPEARSVSYPILLK